jgi:hypothetical protein
MPRAQGGGGTTCGGGGGAGGAGEAGLPPPDVTSRPPLTNRELPRPQTKSAPLCCSPSLALPAALPGCRLPHRLPPSACGTRLAPLPPAHLHSCKRSSLFPAASPRPQCTPDVFVAEGWGAVGGKLAKKLTLTGFQPCTDNDLLVGNDQPVFRSSSRDSLDAEKPKPWGRGRSREGAGCGQQVLL